MIAKQRPDAERTRRGNVPQVFYNHAGLLDAVEVHFQVRPADHQLQMIPPGDIKLCGRLMLGVQLPVGFSVIEGVILHRVGQA